MNIRQWVPRLFRSAADLATEWFFSRQEGAQIAIKCDGELTSDSWNNVRILPTISGDTPCYVAFKPRRAVLSELIIATFENKDIAPGPVRRATSVDSCADLVLVQAYSGSMNCLSSIPNESGGIPGGAFARDAANGRIDWPVIGRGVATCIAFAVEPSVLYQIEPPPGMTTADIKTINVTARFALFGPAKR